MANSSDLQTPSSTVNNTQNSQQQSKKCNSPPLSRTRQRWQLLSKAIRLKQFVLDDLVKTQNEHGDRKLKPQRDPLSTIESFGLMTFEPAESVPWVHCRWNRQFQSKCEQDFFVDVKLAPNRMQLQDLAGFDNSGNVRVWLSEEVLAYLVNGFLKHRLKDRVICELGAGMTALAGLVCARLGLHRKLYLTDGNERCVANIREIVQRNFPKSATEVELITQNGNASGNSQQIYVQRLCWNDRDDGEYRKLHHQIETIICADCLFCCDAHQSLIDTIDHLLVVENAYTEHSDPPNSNLIKRSKMEDAGNGNEHQHQQQQPFLTEQAGHAFILAPRRGDKLDRFIDRVVEDGRFLLMVYESYDVTICEASDRARQRDPVQFDPDTSYPFLLVMKRRHGRDTKFLD